MMDEYVDMNETILHTNDTSNDNVDQIITIISNVWMEITGAESVEYNRSFFQIGGDSIIIMKVYTKLKNTFYNQLKLTDFFVYPTIEKLSLYLAEQIRLTEN